MKGWVSLGSGSLRSLHSGLVTSVPWKKSHAAMRLGCVERKLSGQGVEPFRGDLVVSLHRTGQREKKGRKYLCPGVDPLTSSAWPQVVPIDSPQSHVWHQSRTVGTQDSMLHLKSCVGAYQSSLARPAALSHFASNPCKTSAAQRLPISLSPFKPISQIRCPPSTLFPLLIGSRSAVTQVRFLTSINTSIALSRKQQRWLARTSTSDLKNCSSQAAGEKIIPPEDWWTANALKIIIGANVAVFLFWQWTKIRRFMAKNFAISTHGVMKEWRLHTVLTSIFSHYDPVHLGTNMLTLYFFGAEVLAMLGGRRFLQLFMWGGFFSSMCQVAWPSVSKHLSLSSEYRVSPYQLGLGASGAVNAVVAYSLCSVPHRIVLLFFVLPVPAAGLGAIFLAKDVTGLYYGDSSYGNAAHLGGSLFGFLFWLRFRTTKPKFAWQSSGPPSAN